MLKLAVIYDMQITDI